MTGTPIRSPHVSSTLAIKKVLLFSDPATCPQLFRHIPHSMICGLVGSGIRPDQHAELQELASFYELPFIIQPKVSDADYAVFEKKIKTLDADLMLVFSYSLLIRKSVLALAKWGGINIHGGLLPQYRGSNPIQWALINGENETAITMHRMTDIFDEGEILAERKVPILFTDTWIHVFTRLTAAADDLLKSELPEFFKGNLRGRAQDPKLARHHKRRHPKDGMIDWNQSVLSLYNLVRALVKPLPGAFYYDGLKKVILDSYLSIPQITFLKYSIGKKRLGTSNIYINPLMADDFAQIWAKKIIDEGPLQEQNDRVFFLIFCRSSGKSIGICGLKSIRHEISSAEIHVSFFEGDRSLDYQSDAATLLKQYAFEDLNLKRIYE